MADLRALVDEMASALAGSPVTVLQGRHRPRAGSSLHTFDAAGRSASARTGFALHDLLRRMDEVLRPDGEDRTLVVELVRDDAGRAELRYTFDLPTVAPVRLVLDPHYRHPHHPTSPMPAPPGVAVSDRPTDPQALATIGALVAEFAATYERTTGHAPELGAGHSEEDIHAAEAAMGLRLPEDLRALYRTVSQDEYGLLGEGTLLRLDTVVETYLAGGPGVVEHDDLFAVFPVVYEAYPPGRVRRVSRSDWWVEVGTDSGGNDCMVDLDPGPHGRPGQIIEYGRDFHGPVGYVAESVTAALRDAIGSLRGADDSSRRAWIHPRYSHSERVGQRRVADVVAGLDVQELYLNDGDVLHLAELAPLRHLRNVSVNRAARVTAALPPGVPVEWLSIDAAEIDLPPLGAHPTLWGLRLATRLPISIGSLTGLPALSHLDLSAAKVSDLHRLADLTGLRVLELDLAQWRELREHGPLPAGLAAAALNGFARLEDADQWADWLRGAVEQR
ncbi:SMI1/KNR4 family protein [Micromonospora coxensis]|uniref:SMI1 / KNR4 family (SUKH-1) n=1 Tax=Micromonospora coxensis TaxID=356852 RepID=A0A1C5H2Z8_9ACTN|nr:SMI1/KNR4 family protein [Micromonospora coxensis]SCG39801.1 SMI1 / KNR4 family (SUKH-1) [Micromonospora coxensis]